MSYQKPEILDPAPTGDTVRESIIKTDLNVDDIYWSLNDLLSKIPGAQQPQELLDAIKTVDGPGSGLDADYLDGIDSLGFELNLGNPIVNGYILSSSVTGVRTWIPAPTGGSPGDITWEEIIAIMAPHWGDGSTIDADLLDGIHASGFSQAGHGHNDATQTDPGFLSIADKTKLDGMSDPALLEEFKAFSTGAADAGMPIKLDSYGVLDVSFISIRVFNLVGDWTPTAGNEYPAPADPGDYWIIENVGDIISGGYTFTGGYLNGKTIYDNELLVKGRDDKWGIIHMKVDPNLYYRLDGTNHLTADFQAGGFKLIGVANGVDANDAVNKFQLDAKLDISAQWTPETTNWMELGQHLGVDTACRIDFHAQAAAVDYDFVISRNSGANGNAVLSNNGSGDISLECNGVIRSNGHRVWDDYYHPSSGGDADTLDGYDSTAFAKIAEPNVFTVSQTIQPSSNDDAIVAFRNYDAGMKLDLGYSRVNNFNYLSSYLNSTTATPLRTVGHLIPYNPGAYDLGSATYPWDDIYGTITRVPSIDSAIEDVNDIDTNHLLALLEMKPRSFKYKQRADQTLIGFNVPFAPDKDDSIHFGFVFEELAPALSSQGFNAGDFAFSKDNAVGLSEIVPLLVKAVQVLHSRLVAGGL